MDAYGGARRTRVHRTNAAALSRLVVTYCPSPDSIPTASDDLPSSDLFVYEFVAQNKEVRADRIRTQFGAGVETRLRRLCTRGFLVRKTVFLDPSEGKIEKIYSAALSVEECYLLIDGDTVGDRRLTNAKQKSCCAR